MPHRHAGVPRDLARAGRCIAREGLVILHRLPSVLRELSGVDRARLAAGDVQAERDGAGVQGSRRDRQPAELSAPAARLTTGAPAPADAARARRRGGCPVAPRSEEHTTELQSLIRISYTGFCWKKKRNKVRTHVT